MSETSVESSSGGGGNVFTRKVGPLPMWGWMAIILVIVVAYSYFKKQHTGTAATAAAAAAGNAPGGVDASLVPQFINQTYTDVQPPAAPNITVNNTVPSSDNDHAPSTWTPPTPKAPTPTPVPMQPSEPIFNGRYTVKKGQTLIQVAQQFGISREQLAHANGLGTGAGLRDGQVLVVPVPAPGGHPNKAI